MSENYEGLSQIVLKMLADISAKFRKRCLKNYGLCPSH